MSRKMAFLVFLAWTMVLVAFGLFLSREFLVRRVAYSLARQAILIETVEGVKGYPELASRNFIIRYSAGQIQDAKIVLSQAEAIKGEVDRRLGYRPGGKVLLILEANEEAFRRAFDWGPQEDVLGAYYEGTIRLLAPSAWVGSNDPVVEARLFRQQGPLAHEYTHLVLDYQTAGNFPRWYTEGLAQYEERLANGFQWVEPDNNLLREPLYGMDQLRQSFYSLPNQALAYREALGLVSFLVSRNGPGVLPTLDRGLARGLPFEAVLQQDFGLSYRSLWSGFLAFIRRHPSAWSS